MSYSGSCHCGVVTFTVAGDIPTEAMSCNCSHCRRKGFLLTFVPADQFTLDSGDDALTSYTFNTHKLQHSFCKTCGVQGFATGKGPDGADTCAVNLRAVPACNLDSLAIQHVDGASF